MIADAHWQPETAKWQAKYGRDPTASDRQRAWLRLVNKVRTDIMIGMKATKLNAQVQVQVQLTNLQTCSRRGRRPAAASDQRRQLNLG